ncbi:MAG: M56 family metallopeptidase [Flavobacteriales bacterium]
MNYLIEANIAFSIFFLAYVVLLRQLTHFSWNRLYLLLSLLISALIPCISIPVESSTEFFPSVLLPAVYVNHVYTEIGIQISLMSIIYWTGVVVGLLWLLVSAIRILRLSRNSVEQEHISNTYLASEGNHAFSFFNSILIGNRINAELRDMILNHESIHQRQMHSVDVIVYALARVFFWFNPLVHWAALEVSTNHEYLADEHSLKTFGTDYQYSLLNQALDTRVFALSNSFYKKSLIKNRIIMMNTKRSSGWSKTVYSLMIPLTVGSIWLASCNEAGLPDEVQKDISMDESLKPTNSKIIENLESLDKVPSFPGGQEGMIHFFQTGFEYPEELKTEGVEGTVYISFTVDENGSCSAFEVEKSTDDRLNTPALAFLEQMPEWEPGLQDGEAVKVKMTLPIKYTLK